MHRESQIKGVGPQARVVEVVVLLLLLKGSEGVGGGGSLGGWWPGFQEELVGA